MEKGNGETQFLLSISEPCPWCLLRRSYFHFSEKTTRGHCFPLTSAYTGLPSSSVTPFLISIYKVPKTLLILLMKSSNFSMVALPGNNRHKVG